MAMGPTQTAATVLSGISILLLLTLLGVWVRNYRTFGSSLSLGLVAFGVVLVVENVVALYFFFSMNMLYAGSPIAQRTLLTLRALQLCAVGVLTYVTLK